MSCSVLADQLALRRRHHPVSGDPGARDQPNQEHDNGKHGGSQELGGPKGPVRRPGEVRDVGQLEARDVVDVALADLWFGVCLVLGDDVSQVPARELPHNANDAAGAVL